MIERARSIMVIVTSVAIIGAGFASVVGQVRQRRRPRAHYDSTLPTDTGRINWKTKGLRKNPFRRPSRD